MKLSKNFFDNYLNFLQEEKFRQETFDSICVSAKVFQKVRIAKPQRLPRRRSVLTATEAGGKGLDC